MGSLTIQLVFSPASHSRVPNSVVIVDQLCLNVILPSLLLLILYAVQPAAVSSTI